MSIFKPPDEDPQLDAAIAAVYAELAQSTYDSEEKAKQLKLLSKLYSLKPEKKRVSPDTLAIVLGNIFIALAVIGHERSHVITTKLMSFVTKLK